MSSRQQAQTLTLRVLVLEEANEADVYFHPVKGSQLQRIVYHLHRLLQQLETNRQRHWDELGNFVKRGFDCF